MTHPLRISLALVAVLAATACDREAPPLSDELQRDLAATTSQGVELAPRAGGTQVVSAIEGGAAPAPTPERPAARPTPRPSTRASAPRRSPTPVRPAVNVAPEPAPEPTPVVEAPAEAPAATPAPAPTPETPKPLPQPQQRTRRGGWWNTGDVIRNAPFPINP